ncbi:hypothetical protein DS891_15590 [Pseudoalteromonas sp. JC28]|nr:hypothetical protein [Pseudoalteromonas sp. JC28]
MLPLQKDIFEQLWQNELPMSLLGLEHVSSSERSSHNKVRHSDGFSVAASPSLQSRVCWRR